VQQRIGSGETHEIDPTEILHTALTGLADCHNDTDCWTAGHAN
jgi:hypothetical protein